MGTALRAFAQPRLLLGAEMSRYLWVVLSSAAIIAVWQLARIALRKIMGVRPTAANLLWVYLPGHKENRIRRLEEIRIRKELAARAVELTREEIRAEIERRRENPLPPGKPRYDQGEGTLYGATGEELK